MPTPIEPTAPTDLASASLEPRGTVTPSPSDWRDEILYFLLPDRFSDGNEAQRPTFDRDRPDAFRAPDRASWMAAGTTFQGGTIAGITSKLPYLQELGATALWIGPVWRQRADLETYHGYAIQNFLDVDPRFGTRQDLRDLVDAAHDLGMRVLLDIIYNHSGNNWFYDVGGQPRDSVPYRLGPPHPAHGWRSASGASVPAIADPEDGVWPAEFQRFDWYTRAGQIGNWALSPFEHRLHPDAEYRRGDFFELKDLDLTRDEVLSAVIRVYQYWIALTDCDGFRIDTVKHVPWEASRHFCGAIREYAASIGKHNFLLLGEITGGSEMARDYLEIFGRNIDAVLDVGAPAATLTDTVRGAADPARFFALFGGHDAIGSHRETGRYHVSILDDHDMVGRGMHRFAAGSPGPHRHQQTAHAVGTQLTTLGIPCIYYGTEQALDGTADRHDTEVEPPLASGDVAFLDRYVREALFGADFGPFETAGCHVFDPDHPTYLRIAAIARVRQRRDHVGLALRRGRQYLREIATLGRPFSLPAPGDLVAWSRLLHRQEVLVALNTHGAESRRAEVTVDASLHPAGGAMTFLYRSDWSDDLLRRPPQDERLVVTHVDGRAAVRIDLPPAGMAILA